MQRTILAVCLGAAAAFAPPARTLTSLTALSVNPIDIYSAAEDCLQEECSVDTVPRSAEHHQFRDLDHRALKTRSGRGGLGDYCGERA